MSATPGVAEFSREAALRVGLAARALPETTPARLMYVLVQALGMPLSEDKLNRLTVKHLKLAAEGEFSEIEPVYLKQAIRYLKGERDTDIAHDAIVPQPYQEGEMAGSIRVAFASNTGALLDGHFGSCRRFLIYQVSTTESRLIAVRPVEEPADLSRDDRQAYRVSLVKDCQILYVASIGGPPAGRVINAGVYPLKHPEEVAVQELLNRLQTMLAGNPPPWLAKILGAEPEQRVRFKTGESE
ncbi:MAG: nitrogen fixation protein NifX [Candidatus Competibacteraceae bacterium]